MPTRIRENFEQIYPAYANVFRNVPVVERLRPRDMSIPDAVLRVVVGQMLSTAAARTIHDRVCALGRTKGVEPWKLEHVDLRSCGLSNGKCRTIIEFRDSYLERRSEYDNWPNLQVDDLQRAIVSHWGMSDWTAGILSLFYFGHEDVFPKGDGSLVRAIDTLYHDAKLRDCTVARLDPELARPNRSYLAMYLWRILDQGVI